MKDRLMNTDPLFSKRQVFTVALLSGPLPAGYLLSRNLKRSGYPKASHWARALGYFLAFLLFFLLSFIREGTGPGSGGLNRLLGLTGYQVMLPALVVFPAGLRKLGSQGLVFMAHRNQMKIVFPRAIHKIQCGMKTLLNGTD